MASSQMEGHDERVTLQQGMDVLAMEGSTYP